MSAQSAKFYLMSPQFNRSGLGAENLEVLFARPGVYRSGSIVGSNGSKRGVPHLERPLVLTFDRKYGPPPDDIETFADWWLVSERFKIFAEEVDPEAFEFARCDNSNLAIGDEPAAYWLCDVKRVGSYIDEINSPSLNVREGAGRKSYLILPEVTKIAVNEDALGPGHVFGTPESSPAIFCDAFFREQFRSAGLRLRTFVPV